MLRAVPRIETTLLVLFALSVDDVSCRPRWGRYTELPLFHHVRSIHLYLHLYLYLHPAMILTPEVPPLLSAEPTGITTAIIKERV